MSIFDIVLLDLTSVDEMRIEMELEMKAENSGQI
jgi:hypothetical protein